MGLALDLVLVPSRKDQALEMVMVLVKALVMDLGKAQDKVLGKAKVQAKVLDKDQERDLKMEEMALEE